MPKVMHVISGLKVGGAEMMLHRLIGCFEGSEYSHLVVSLSSGGDMEQRFKSKNIRLIILDFKRTPVVSLFKLFSVLRKEKPQIVQTWMYHSDLLGGVVARLSGIKNVIWGVRTTNVSSGGLTSLIRKLCAFASRIIPRVIICAAQASKASHAQIGYDASRMLVIPNGFELEKLVASQEQRNSIRVEYDVATEDLLVGSVGRYSAVKDHRTFIRAAGLLAARFSAVKFLLVGRDLDKNNADLTALIEGTGFAERFICLGERSDIPACFKAMDIFCLHSITEGFPNALGEAMSIALPCVTTDVGDAAYLLGDAGIVVPSQNPESLAKALETLIIASPAERLGLGERAHKRVVENFTMSCAKNQFERIYEQLTLLDKHA